MKIERKWIWQHPGWPEFRFDVNPLLPVLTAITRRIGALEVTCRTLAGDVLIDARERILADDAMETSAIEGEILRRSSVRASVRKQLGLPVLHDDSDTRTDALVAMLLDARECGSQLLVEEKILAWHASLFPTGYSGLYKINAGRYRGEEEMRIVSGPLGKEQVHYVAPPKSRLSEEMKRFLAWLVSDTSGGDPLIMAGVAHLWFVMIHPFDDGNGRMARAITDYLLAKYSPPLMQVISFSKHVSMDRKGYYQVMEAAGKGGLDITPWLQWFLQTLTNALVESEWIVGQVVSKAIFRQAHSETDFNARQQKMLTRLLDMGDHFVGGMTTRKYAGMCKCSKVTASRDLVDLEARGILEKMPSGGRSTSYRLKK